MNTFAIVRASNNSLVLVSRRRALYIGSQPRLLRLLSTTNEWRKHQLDKLEKQFDGNKQAAVAADKNNSESKAHVLNIANDEDLQPMWKQMESRVKNRRSYRLGGGRPGRENLKVGRRNVRQTEEDVWLQQGLYDDISEGSEKNE